MQIGLALEELPPYLDEATLCLRGGPGDTKRKLEAGEATCTVPCLQFCEFLHAFAAKWAWVKTKQPIFGLPCFSDPHPSEGFMESQKEGEARQVIHWVGKAKRSKTTQSYARQTQDQPRQRKTTGAALCLLKGISKRTPHSGKPTSRDTGEPGIREDSP